LWQACHQPDSQPVKLVVLKKHNGPPKIGVRRAILARLRHVVYFMQPSTVIVPLTPSSSA
jgi:hypothetical protein